MNIVATFDPSVLTSDTFTVPQSAANGKIDIWNESSFGLMFTFQSGATVYIPAWVGMPFCGTFGNVNVTWQQHTQLVSNGSPLSQVNIIAYDSNEKGQGLVHPVSLQRQTNIGNASTVLTAASSIQNDGNVAGTTVIEATIGADLSSAVLLTNDAQFQIGNATRPGAILMPGVNNILGITVAGDTISATGTDLFLKARAGKVVQEDISGHHITEVSSGGLALLAGTLSFLLGSVSRISLFTATVNAPAFVNHGLGVVPDIILFNNSTLHATVLVATYEFSSMTNTQVKMQANGSVDITALAIKF
jgi:hypothetical protein